MISWRVLILTIDHVSTIESCSSNVTSISSRGSDCHFVSSLLVVTFSAWSWQQRPAKPLSSLSAISSPNPLSTTRSRNKPRRDRTTEPRLISRLSRSYRPQTCFVRSLWLPRWIIAWPLIDFLYELEKLSTTRSDKSWWTASSWSDWSSHSDSAARRSLLAQCSSASCLWIVQFQRHR